MYEEIRFEMFPMTDGSFRIALTTCGDTSLADQGVIEIVSECDSYEEALKALDRLMDRGSSEYIFTKYLPIIHDRDGRKFFTGSHVEVRFADRKCDCFDFRDIRRKRWSVWEHDYWAEDSRILGNRLWYAEAITLANLHAAQQPCACRVTIPKIFQNFREYEQHFCEQHPRLCLPRGF